MGVIKNVVVIEEFSDSDDDYWSILFYYFQLEI